MLIVAIVVVFFGWLNLVFENAGFYNPSTGTALYAVVSFSSFVGALFFVSSKLNEIDTAQKKAEDKIKAFSAEIAAANKELEAFSYSVSHDLRAPLRGIDGFSQALLEDYYEELDDQGKDYLRRVRAGAQRMGQLIDDMLALSRSTRGEIVLQMVDLSALASRISAELGKEQPQRSLEWVIPDGITAVGDARLLAQVMQNLLSNAWKFTGKTNGARIEFGVTKNGGTNVYFVKDNGVGFDMRYKDKLFVPFQRLHAATEFPGNGIGLTTVQRIVHRHGGSVWAEGEPGKGATFYFSFQKERRQE